MGLISLTCPNCGAKLDNLDDRRDTYFCTYCGHTITHDKTIIEHRGSVNLTGVANENSLLQRAKNFLEEGNYKEAKNYFDRVLDINPNRGAAYMGLLLCKYAVPNTETLKLTVPVDFSGDITYNRAVQFAAPDEKARFMDVNGSEHQFLIQLTNRNNNIETGRAQIEKEREELLGRQESIKSQCEADMAVIKLRLQGAQVDKAGRDKEYGKVIFKAVLILIVGIVALIIGAKLEGGWSFVGFAIFVLALVSQLIALIKERRRIFRYGNPNKTIASCKADYEKNVNAYNQAVKLINQINGNFDKRVNDYMAVSEKEKQNFISEWKIQHPNDRV